MLSINATPARFCDSMSRREIMRIGGLSLAGLSLPNLRAARERAPMGVPPTDKTFGRAKNVIFLYLAGGPPQHETFDPKPNAPLGIRGPFNPISTNVPDMHFCELLPRTAKLADKLAVIRSMATDDNTHSSSGYWVLTGNKYVGPNARTIQPTDWPYFGSIIKRHRPSEVLPPLSTVWVPDMMRLNENVTPAGQTAGFMGSQWDPDQFVGDPSQPEYKVDGLRMAAISPLRLKNRQQLLKQVERHFESSLRGPQVKLYDKFQQQAFELLTTDKARKAFAIDLESSQIRERYGHNRWGQCVLLARRLVEAGVRLVHVQWPREPGDNAVDNPLWDTHAQNADRLEDVLCPQFDVGFSALIEDLDQRGLLDETLVVAIGEFGRTPKINSKGGRDHWGAVFSFAMAGAGISGGQVYGSSDKQGGHPKDNRVEPGDLTATIFHLLGLNYQSTFHDREGREHRITTGQPMFDLLGLQPATKQRVVSSGSIARVPPFDPALTLMQSDFRGEGPIKSADTSSRPKGWRGSPLLDEQSAGFGVKVLDHEAAIGLHTGEHKEPIKITKGSRAILAQEVRSPFAGTYHLRIMLQGFAESEAAFASIFHKNFSCHLEFFQYTKATKNVKDRKRLAAIKIEPKVADSTLGNTFNMYELSKTFVNPKPGSNFSFGLGLGIALIIEKTSEGVLEYTPGSISPAFVRISSVRLEFAGKQRNEKVQV